jgi:hypothetical protein
MAIPRDTGIPCSVNDTRTSSFVMPRQTAAVLSDSVDHYKFRIAYRCCAAQHQNAADTYRRG